MVMKLRSKAYDPRTNSSILMMSINNSSAIPAREFSQHKLSVLCGSLVVAGMFHFIIGFTGLVGVCCRYIGPITIVPTIVLVGLGMSEIVVKFLEPSVPIGMIVVAFTILFSLILGDKLIPVPFWTKAKGFHIHRSRVHRMFPILLSMIIAWVISAILTQVGYFTDDPSKKEYLARTDSRSYILEQSEWIIFPYPGKLNGFTFEAGIFINFIIATLMSVLDSVADYAATAKAVRVPPPPQFGFNRAISVEGLMICLGACLGCPAATVSFGANIGAMRLSRVVSRRILQVVGIMFILLSITGKISAFFMTIPYPVLGGTNIVTTGILIGVILSYLESVDLSSTRNLAILGMAMLLGTVLPKWMQRNQDSIDTGLSTADSLIRMLLTNPAFVGGGFAFLLDNSVSGTLKSRGLLSQLKDLDDGEAKQKAKGYVDGIEVYRFPWIPKCLSRSRFIRYIPIFYHKYEPQ